MTYLQYRRGTEKLVPPSIPALRRYFQGFLVDQLAVREELEIDRAASLSRGTEEHRVLVSVLLDKPDPSLGGFDGGAGLLELGKATEAESRLAIICNNFNRFISREVEIYNHEAVLYRRPVGAR